LYREFAEQKEQDNSKYFIPVLHFSSLKTDWFLYYEYVKKTTLGT